MLILEILQRCNIWPKTNSSTKGFFLLNFIKSGRKCIKIKKYIFFTKHQNVFPLANNCHNPKFLSKLLLRAIVFKAGFEKYLVLCISLVHTQLMTSTLCVATCPQYSPQLKWGITLNLHILRSNWVNYKVLYLMLVEGGYKWYKWHSIIGYYASCWVKVGYTFCWGQDTHYFAEDN